MHNIIPYKIQFVFTWLTFALIGIGLITLIIRYKEMLFLGQNVKNPDFLREKLEVEFLMVALCCAGLLVAIVVLPHISLGYSLNKLYSTALVILAVFFVVGGITLSKIISIVKQTFEKSIKKKFASESVNKKKASEVWAVLIILLVLIPYFLCVSGFMYDIFDVPRGLILRSEGEMYDWLYVHDQETYGIKWLTLYREEKDKLFADFLGNRMMVGYAKIPHYNIHFYWLTEKSTDVNGYIYLKYQNSIKGKLRGHSSTYDIAEYSEIFSKTNRIYDSGGSEIWR